MAGSLRLNGTVEKKARRMLKDVCRILDKYDIHYILESGTLLGIIREDRLLPWDNDIDITVTQDYLPKLLRIRKKIWLAGYKTRIRKSIVDVPYIPKGSIRVVKIQTHKFLIKEYALMDIFIKKKVGDNYYWSVRKKKPVLKSAPAQFFEETTTYNFDGYDYSIPKYFEEYLAFRYGDWKTPVKDWSYVKDDKAIVKS